MKCAICGKEMGETELGKQYCYDCEQKWFPKNDETSLKLTVYKSAECIKEQQ